MNRWILIVLLMPAILMANSIPREIWKVNTEKTDERPLTVIYGETRDIEVQFLNYSVPLDLTDYTITLHAKIALDDQNSYQIAAQAGRIGDVTAASNGWASCRIQTDVWLPAGLSRAYYTLEARQGSNDVRLLRGYGDLIINGTAAASTNSPVGTGGTYYVAQIIPSADINPSGSGIGTVGLVLTPAVSNSIRQGVEAYNRGPYPTNTSTSSGNTNGFVTAEITNGLAAADCTNGYVTAEITNGLAAADCTNGYVTAEITNGLAAADCTNGYVTAEITNGLAAADCTNGYVTAEITNGLAAADCTNGYVTADITNGLAGADCTNGFVTADITNGLAGADCTNGFVAADITNGLAGADCTNGYVTADITNGLAGADCTNGYVTAEITNGLAGADCTNGFVTADITNGYLSVTGYYGIAGDVLMIDSNTGSVTWGPYIEQDPIFLNWLAYADLGALGPRITTAENNIMLTAFRVQAMADVSYRDMIDCWVDGFVDQTGIDTAACSSVVYDSDKRSYGLNTLVPDALRFSMFDLTLYTNIPPLDLSGDFSFSCWIKIGDTYAGEFHIFDTLSWDSAPYGGFVFYIVGGKMAYWCASNGNRPQSSGTNVISDSDWHHVAWVVNQTNMTIQYWLDGVLDAEDALAATASPIHTTDGAYVPVLGGWSFVWTAGAGYPMSGSLDEAAFFERKLTEEEIESVAGGTPFIGSEEGLAMLYNFSGTLEDSSVRSNASLVASTRTMYASRSNELSGLVGVASLVSTNFTASKAISAMDAILILQSEGLSGQLNTDIVFNVSSDSGTNWGPMPLLDAGVYDSAHRFYRGSYTNIVNSGNSVKWKLETTNSATLHVNGVSVSAK